MSSNSNLIRSIAVPYSIYFLYLEPVFALGGTYLCLFHPEKFVNSTVPVPAIAISPTPITPVVQLLLTNIGSLYAMFAIFEGVLLRLTREKTIWLTVICTLLASDCGHIYAVYQVAPERISEFMKWNSDEWINYGTLILGALMRAAFVAGIGRN
jgi:hypothetical protein